jgi:hypothetical protein
MTSTLNNQGRLHEICGKSRQLTGELQHGKTLLNIETMFWSIPVVPK